MSALASSLLGLSTAYAAHQRLPLWRVGHLVTQKGSFFTELRDGNRTCRLTTFERALGWFSDHWPHDLDWPEGIQRPEPSPDSPAAESSKQSPVCQIANPPASGKPPAACQIDDPVAAVEALNDQIREAMRKSDFARADRLGERAKEIALRLNPATGRIASPAALCAAVGCNHQAYDDAIRRYGGARNARKRPRSMTEGIGLIVTLLRASGDERFPRHDARPQRSTGSIADAAVMEVADALSARL